MMFRPASRDGQAEMGSAREQLARARDGEIEQGASERAAGKAGSAQSAQGPQACQSDARH